MRKTSLNGILVLQDEEGVKLSAYKDSVGIWTIATGNTHYEDGSPVKEGDVVTKERAAELFAHLLPSYEAGVNRLVTSNINQNQFDALISFEYNEGEGALAKSTLLKEVNANPNHPHIKDDFLMWNKEKRNGALQVTAGMTNRRNKEIELYFKPL